MGKASVIWSEKLIDNIAEVADRREVKMPWYVIQTYTGNEEKLVEMIRRIVPQKYYGECFAIYAEQLWHRQQENQIHVLRLFPGYIFISSDDIEQLFRCLKKVPAMSKIMASDDFSFTPLHKGEAEFLLNIMDKDHIVRLSYVATDGGDHVTYLSGPLERCRNQIRSYRFRKRYAAVRLTLDGQEKEVKLGIILNDDIRRELAYGKVEAAVEVTEKYRIWRDGLPEKDDIEAADRVPTGIGDWGSAMQKEAVLHEEDGQKKMPQFTAGDQVLVMEGAFEGSVASVCQVRKSTLWISVQMFGREIQAEVPKESVKKIK